MSETRIKGQEVTVRISRQRQIEASITAIKDLTIQFDFATLEEGYLGEKTMRKDDIFNGLSGSMTIDAESQDVFQLIEFIKLRAQRDPSISLADSRINATATFAFPNGQRPKIVVRDMKFDAIPIGVPSRDGYVNMTLSWKAEDARVLYV